MKHLKWSGVIATTVFIALAQQACSVAAEDEQGETSTESAVTAEAQEALNGFNPDCVKNSDCLKDEECINGRCVQVQEYPSQ